MQIHNFQHLTFSRVTFIFRQRGGRMRKRPLAKSSATIFIPKLHFSVISKSSRSIDLRSLEPINFYQGLHTCSERRNLREGSPIELQD